MGWLIPLIQFGYGFVRGMASGDEPTAHGEWERHMFALAQNTRGVELRTLKPNNARFSVNYRGTCYTMVLTLHGTTAMMSIASLIVFPPGRLPQDVVQFLLDKNREMPRCSYDCIDDQDGAFFLVTCRINAGDLTLAAFQAAMTELLSYILALEKTLVSEGYVA